MFESASGAHRRWKFDWKLLVFSGFFLPLLLSLGVWQLERAEEKTELLAQWKAPGDQVDWPAQLKKGLQVGQPVTLSGSYGEQTWLLDNRTRDGAPGYEILTLFQPESGASLVVNRGWVRAPRLREQLPDVSTPSGKLVLSGRLSNYPEPPVLMDAPVKKGQWPRRVQALTREDAQSVDAAVASLLLRLEGPEQPGAYRADWAPDRMGAQTHYGYAAQWFSLAAALVILTLVASYRKP